MPAATARLRMSSPSCLRGRVSSSPSPSRGRVREGAARRLLIGAFIAVFLVTIPIAAAAAGTPGDSSSATVDELWNQPTGVSPDSSLYLIQSWWDSLSRASQRDPSQRGFAELAQANTDLLNAYTLIVQQRQDPGPRPVPVIDPLISSVYGFVTGNHPKAPLGTVFGWINQLLLNIEGRGSTRDIIKGLLRDYQARQSEALRDLQGSQATSDAWKANWDRQDGVLQKIAAVAPGDDGIAQALAQVQSDRKQQGKGSDGKGPDGTTGKDKDKKSGQGKSKG